MKYYYFLTLCTILFLIIVLIKYFIYNELFGNKKSKFVNIVFSDSVVFFKSKILNEFKNLKDNYNVNEPCIFFGIYRDEDIELIKNHKSYGLIIWGGSDSMKEEKLEFISKLNTNKFFNISISRWVQDDLNNYNIKNKLIPWYSLNKKNWNPVKKGEYIYIYLPDHNKEFYGEDLFNKIKKKVNYKFIIGDPNKFKKDEMQHVYSKCFIGLRLVNHDGSATTVQELGLMGIKCVHNGDSPSALNYENLDDIIEHINNESKYIGTTDHYLAKKMNHYLKIEDNFFEVNSYIGNNNIFKNIKKHICIITCVWKRYELTKIILEYLVFIKKELINDFNIDIIVVGSEGKKYETLCKNLSIYYIEHPNKPLNKKFNAASKFCEKFNPDAVLLTGSDDIITPNTIKNLMNKLDKKTHVVGVTDLHVYDSVNQIIYKWLGYTDKIRINIPIGAGRLFDNYTLKKLDWLLWDTEIEINRGLDSNNRNKLKKYEISMKGYSQKSLDGFVVDIKGASKENITSLERMINNNNESNKNDKIIKYPLDNTIILLKENLNEYFFKKIINNKI
jgi:hypothetical protein